MGERGKEFKLFLLIVSFALIIISLNFISAWEFNGTIRDVNSNVLFNATINVTVRDSTFTVLGYNSTVSNQTGWFNLTVLDNATWFYEPKIEHFQNNATGGSTPIDFVGQSVPSFSFFELQNGLSVNFYLREAGTINISAVNATGSPVVFNYVIKDQKLGFPIAESFTSYISSATIYVPRDRNYSIMIFPNNSMPVSFDWNNFSATSSYTIAAGLSDYNLTTHILNKTFNVTETLLRVSGSIADNLGAINGWDEFTVVPFILEPGNMVFLGQGATMPYNMSAWGPIGNETDTYNLGTGSYNITLPGPAESADYILFATARNGTGYYGGYRNMSLNFTDSGTEINFTMYPLMSTNWAGANSNISMDNAAGWSKINISSAKQSFNLVNSTTFLNQVSAHMEVTVDYSNYNATEFTFMLDIAQSGSASFYVPLINATGVKEMNVYSMNYAPKRVGTRTAAEIIANNNITLSSFNPGDIEGSLAASNLVMELYISNSTCDVPNPNSACIVGSSSNMDDHNPLGAMIGGGKLSFRMGTGGTLIHYVNVDMLASGPPDVLFDGSLSETTSSGFDSALRFGSLGPKIYDYVLVSIPYTEGSTSTTGLDENAQVNISIPLFYAENSTGSMDWVTPIWNTTANGTAGSNFAGNYSYYSAKQTQWNTLMGNNTCITNVSNFNATNPCYIDKASNRIWIRLPHFSGTKPSATGSVITATTTSTSSGSGGGGGSSSLISGDTHLWTKITPGVVSIMKNINKKTGVKEIQIEVNNEAQNVKITVFKHDGKPASVSVEKTGKVYKYLQIEAENLGDNLKRAIIKIQVEKNWTTDNGIERDNILLFKFNNNSNTWNELTTTFSEEDDNYYFYDVELNSFSYFAISEKSTTETSETTGTTISDGDSLTIEEETGKRSLIWSWVLIGLIGLAIMGFLVIKKRKH